MGVEDDLVPAEPTPDDMRLGARIAGLAQDPTDDARARIMAAVRSAPPPATAPRRRIAMGSRWRLALVGFGATGLLFTATGGALAASTDALPSSPAYGLRRFGENLRATVANPRQQPRLHLQFAAEKVRQAKAQLRQGDVSDAGQLLSDSRHDLEDARAELQNIHDPAEVLGLTAQESQLQADANSEQDQVDTIVKGGTTTAPLSSPSPTPGEGSAVPAPEATALPPANPRVSPDFNPPPSPDSTPAQ